VMGGVGGDGRRNVVEEHLARDRTPRRGLARRGAPERGRLPLGPWRATSRPGTRVVPAPSAATRTRRSTGRASAISGALKAPIDWATTTTLSTRSSMAVRETARYRSSPAASSSTGRSTAIVEWPARSRIGTTRCQYHGVEPAPGSRTKVDTSDTTPRHA
jgi:hypothetical protein